MNMKTEMYKAALIWCLAFLISSTALYSQVDEIQFEKISNESGLSQSTILSMYQDSRGFLWFGTYEDLNQFDGYSFKVFKMDPQDPHSLTSNNIQSIIEDHLGIMWIGTEDGLKQFDRQTERFIHDKNDPRDPTSLSNNYVRYLYEDRSGVLWIATQGGGLNQFDREKKQFKHYRHVPENQTSLSDNSVSCMTEDDPHNSSSLSHNAVWRVYKDRENNLWVGTWGGGLNMFDGKRNRFIRYANNPSLKLFFE